MSNNKEYVITKVVIRKNDVVLKYLDNDEEKELILFPLVFSEYYLYEGKVLSPEELKSIKQTNKTAKYFNIAYKEVARKEYSTLLLKRKLKEKKVDEEFILRIIKTLQEQHLLDDERYALELKESLDIKLYGKNYIIKSLKDCGISQDIIDSMNFDNEEAKITQLLPLLLKKKSHESYLMMKKKVHDELYRRGFSSDLIKETIDSIDQIKPIDDNQEYAKCFKDYQKYLRLYQSKYDRKEIISRIKTSLMRKGYTYDIIIQVMEDDENE